MEKFKVIVKLSVSLLVAIGAAFGVDALFNGACAANSVLDLGIEQCQVNKDAE